MSETIKVWGPPGTGKTTYLLDKVQDELARGVLPEQIVYTSFTKAAALEARDRARKRFPDYSRSNSYGSPRFIVFVSDAYNLPNKMCLSEPNTRSFVISMDMTLEFKPINNPSSMTNLVVKCWRRKATIWSSSSTGIGTCNWTLTTRIVYLQPPWKRHGISIRTLCGST